MSVSIVNHREIDILAKAIVKYKVDFRSDDYLRSVCSETEIGQSLVNQNYRSVNERYEENTIPPQYKFKDDNRKYNIISCSCRYSDDRVSNKKNNGNKS